LALIILLSVLSCREGQKRAYNDDVDSRIRSEWAKNIYIIEKDLAGKRPIGEEFIDACIFFQRLTGIEISGTMSFDGWMPNRDSARGLSEVKIWYKKNKKLLCWNEEIRSVVRCDQRTVKKTK